LVAVSGKPGALEIVERRRIDIIDPMLTGAKQPFHFAKELPPENAERFVADCARTSQRLATELLREMIGQMQKRELQVVSCGVLLASGRPLPSLPLILASHSLIHTAEGEFFREAFRRACSTLEIPVTGIRERELSEQFDSHFGARAAPLRREIAELGASMGPPWTTDQKSAALAALMVLTGF
jgi:hypothetical protein